MDIRKILFVRKDWSIGSIPFPQRMFRLAGYQIKGNKGMRDGSNLSREKHNSNLELG
jgi:hypothetical protein